MQCDMCGKSTNLFRTKIEGAELNVCKDCGGHGKILGIVKTKEEKILEEQRIRDFLEKKRAPEEIVTSEMVANNYADIIRKKRMQLKLTQEEFARKLNEKESLIHHIEQGKHCPSISLARKLEKMLNIILVIEVKEDLKIEVSKSESFTIGDILKNIKKN